MALGGGEVAVPPRFRLRLSYANVVLALVSVGALVFASPEALADRCSLSGAVLTVTGNGRGTWTFVRRHGDTIQVNFGQQCSGGTPTVFNTSTIVLRDRRSARYHGLGIDLGGGPFAPGAGPLEPGAEEIEFAIRDRGRLDSLSVDGGKGAQRIDFGKKGGRNGIDLNPRDPVPDVDVTLSGIDSNPFASMGSGDDRVRATGGPAFGAPFGLPLALLGGSGDDQLVGGSGHFRRFGDYLEGGPGHDVLRGVGGPDRIVSAERGSPKRDKVDCGPGRGRAIADHRDRVRRCTSVRRR